MSLRKTSNAAILQDVYVLTGIHPEQEAPFVAVATAEVGAAGLQSVQERFKSAFPAPAAIVSVTCLSQMLAYVEALQSYQRTGHLTALGDNVLPL